VLVLNKVDDCTLCASKQAQCIVTIVEARAGDAWAEREAKITISASRSRNDREVIGHQILRQRHNPAPRKILRMRTSEGENGLRL
jgi:hypothetical protein